MSEKFDVIVIGAGAAGLMCAAEAGKRGRRVLVVEPKIAQLTVISGKKIPNALYSAGKNLSNAISRICTSAVITPMNVKKRKKLRSASG